MNDGDAAALGGHSCIMRWAEDIGTGVDGTLVGPIPGVVGCEDDELGAPVTGGIDLLAAMVSSTSLSNFGAPERSMMPGGRSGNNSKFVRPHNSHLYEPERAAYSLRSCEEYSREPIAPLPGVGKKAIKAVKTVRTGRRFKKKT